MWVFRSFSKPFLLTLTQPVIAVTEHLPGTEVSWGGPSGSSTGQRNKAVWLAHNTGPSRWLHLSYASPFLWRPTEVEESMAQLTDVPRPPTHLPSPQTLTEKAHKYRANDNDARSRAEFAEHHLLLIQDGERSSWGKWQENSSIWKNSCTKQDKGGNICTNCFVEKISIPAN